MGELGWELYIPSEFVSNVYESIVREGSDFGLMHAGYHALESLRLEKAYRSWGHDITNVDTPLEAGLRFAVSLDKGVDFIGKDALLRQRERGLEKRLAIFVLRDPEPLLLGDEPIYRDGVIVGCHQFRKLRSRSGTLRGYGVPRKRRGRHSRLDTFRLLRNRGCYRALSRQSTPHPALRP